MPSDDPTLADAMRAVGDALDALPDDVEALDTREMRTNGSVVQVAVRLEVPLDVDARSESDVADSQLQSESDVDDGDDDSSAGDAGETEGSNPYAPEGFADQAVVEVNDGYRQHAQVTIPPMVCEFFEDRDHDRMHFREADGRVELRGGGSDDWPDHSAACSTTSQNRRVVGEMLDVVPGDEVRYEPDGDVVVVEPIHNVERDDEDDGLELDIQRGRFRPTALDILDALAVEQPQTQAELQETTGRAQSSIATYVSALKEDGLVEAEQDPDDGRRYLYALSDEAIAADEREKRHAEAVFG